MSWLLTPLAIAAVAILLGAAFVSRSVVVGRPDEWILLIRDGRCVRSGIGITVLRRPLDTVARFSSAVQRVAFTAEALTQDRVEATIEGYMLWSVATDGEGPFQAFRRLGITSPQGWTPAPKHVLSKAQYRAFQTAMGAAAQSRAAGFTFDALATSQAEFLTALRAACEATMAGLGVRVDEAQVVRVRASEASVQADLTAPASQHAREAAERARVTSEQRLRQLRADAEAAAAQRETESLRTREADRIAAELALEVERRRLDTAAEARKDAALEAALERERRKSEAEAERIRLLLAAEEEKSEALRAYELARLRTEKMAEAFGQLPMKDAHWYTVDSPMSTLAKLIGHDH